MSRSLLKDGKGSSHTLTGTNVKHGNNAVINKIVFTVMETLLKKAMNLPVY